MASRTSLICLLVLIGTVPASAYHFPHVVIGGTSDGYAFEVILQVSSIITQETHWIVYLTPTGVQSGESWTGKWAVNGNSTGDGFDGRYPESFTFRLPARGSKSFTIRGDDEIRPGWLWIRPSDTGDEPYSTRNALSVSGFLRLKTLGRLTGSIGLSLGQWTKEQITLPVYRSATVNTRIAWTAHSTNRMAYGSILRSWLESQYPVVFTLYGAKGEEVRREQSTFSQFTHEARFLDEIFPELSEDFSGTLRISLLDTVDEPQWLTPEEWESIKAKIDQSLVWISGAALRMDTVEQGIMFSSVPIKTGISRFKKTAE